MTCVASLSSTCRFGPMILTELAPFTPDSASSTLSWIYCEKLKPMPGSSSLNSFCSSSVSFSLVRPAGHSSNGFNGANSSTLENGEASLPLSGRPCCDTTVMTSGCRSRISRILPVASVPASSDIVGGIAARIQKLPSSSAGRNSLPSRDSGADAQRQERDARRSTAIFGVGERPAQHRRVGRAQRAHDDGLGLLDLLGQHQRRQHRRHREGRQQRAGQRIAIGARHRPENLAFDALHGEQRHEGGDGDRGGEEHRLVDLQRADENQPQPLGPARRGGRVIRRCRGRIAPQYPCELLPAATGGAPAVDWKLR